MMQSDYDAHLQSYFTDMEPLRDLFSASVVAPKLPKRLIVLHGVGGVGKSSLLRMFRLDCKSRKIPVALASGDDAKSVLDVLTGWVEDLKEDGVKFATFDKTLESYRSIQAKVEEQVKKSQNRAAEIAGKAASKTAEAAGGALLGAAIGSVLPGVGTAVGGALGSVVGGMGAEALTDWLRGFLAKPDIDLLLDPAKRLSADFLEDTAKTVGRKRLILLLDTFEQMTALEAWAGEIAQKIDPNVLIVIAGRKLPGWDRFWPDWMTLAQVEELSPMTEEVMRELIRRYYATLRGGEPDPTQVDAIIRFARGLPMAVTSAVQLWVKYGVEDFQSVKTEVVAGLVDRLMEGVPPALIPALEAAAVVRWFDQPILRAVMQQEDVRDAYNELRRFPFVRGRAEGLALHDSVREMIDENLRVQDCERHCDLHERAAMYFEKRLEETSSEEAERLGLERLYHRVSANEEMGILLFQEMAEGLVRYQLGNRLRELLNDLNTYQLKNDNSKSWREYYNAQLTYIQKTLINIENIFAQISGNKNLTPKLRAYSLCQLAKIWNSPGLRKKPNAIALIVNSVEQSNQLLPEKDFKKAENFITLGVLYSRNGDIAKASLAFEKAAAFCKENGDTYGIASVFREVIVMYGILGDWKKMFDYRLRGLANLPDTDKESIVYSGLYGRFAVGWIEAGRYAEAERNSQTSLSLVQKIGASPRTSGFTNDLIISTGLQGRYKESHNCFLKAKKMDREFHGNKHPVPYIMEGWVLMKRGNLEKAEYFLRKGLEINEAYPPRRSLPENLQLLGLLYETYGKLNLSATYYSKSLEYRWIGRQYYICAALTGLVRVKHAQGDLAAILPLLVEAEQLAQQYEYNDHLASLRLTQGHLRAGNQPNQTSEVWSSALDYYKQAMIYALRYNRFLLDELVSGRPQGTPLHPIIPSLLERGTAGHEVLIALRDWWQSGVNDLGAPRPDTISPIPEGISLLEAEKIARERELGDGSAQRSIVEQFEAAL